MSTRKTLEQHLKLKCLCFSNYANPYNALNCGIHTYNINDVGKGAGGDNSANVTVTLTYTAVVATDVTCTTAEKQMTLNILSTVHDNAWGPNMRARIWRGDYPSAVSVEDGVGDVYLLYLRDYGIELRYFGTLSEAEMCALETIHTDAPYEIKVEPEALFQCLEGDIGNNEMRKHVYIAMNTMPPIKITAVN